MEYIGRFFPLLFLLIGLVMKIYLRHKDKKK